MRISLLEGVEKLKNIENLTLLECYKLFLSEEYENIPPKLRLQEADGFIYLVFSDEYTYAFYPNTEQFSIDFEIIKKSEIPLKVEDISTSDFISKFIGTKIEDVNLIYSEYNNEPYGILLKNFDGESIVLKYLSESEYTFDVLSITPAGVSKNDR